MRKLILLLFIWYVNENIYSQISLDKVMIEEDIRIGGFVQLENSGVKYFLADRDNFVIRFYNTDNSVYRIIQVDTSAIGVSDCANYDYEFYPFFVTENLFDHDNGLEFLLVIQQANGYGGENDGTFIIDDDGSVLFSKINQHPIIDEDLIQYSNFIFNTQDGTKMILKSTNDSGNDTAFIYSLPGSIPCFDCMESPTKSSYLKSTKTNLWSYPNPAKDYTIIKYEIPAGEEEGEILLYSLGGKLMKKYKVDRTFNELYVSTKELKSGTYIYTFRTEKKVLKSNKLIVIE